MIPLQGYAPDQPRATPGTLHECDHFIPYDTGMEAAPSPIAQGSAALASECLGAFLGEKLDGTTVLFAGTPTKLWSLGGTTWTDRTHVAGDYSLTGTQRWCFTQFGDYTLAGSGDDVLQVSTGTTFTDIAGSPQAKCVESVMTSGGGQVFAANTSAGADVWICSAMNDHTSWAPSNATQCTTGRLLSSDGKIVAARKFGAEQIVLYKQRSMYVGFYTGGNEVWQFREIPKIGCVGLDAVANLGYLHVIVGPNDIYAFDGNRPVSIAAGFVREFFAGDLNQTHMHRTIATWDQDRNLVWIFYPSATSSTGRPDHCLVWSPVSKKWGRADRHVEAALFYATSGTTWNSVTGTWNAQNYVWNRPSAATRSFSLFDHLHTLQKMIGTPNNTSFTLHDLGDDAEYSSLTEMRLRYAVRPGTAAMTGYTAEDSGTTFTQRAISYAADTQSGALSRFNPRQTARWHRQRFTFTGGARVEAYQPTLVPAGMR